MLSIYELAADGTEEEIENAEALLCDEGLFVFKARAASLSIPETTSFSSNT